MLPFQERPYRPCAGICLINSDNKIFVGKRIDTQTDAWQMPQGGIDDGETPSQAAIRELIEEIGTNKAEIITQLSEPLDYDLPNDLADRMWNAAFRGQRQYWFLMHFTGNDKDINLETEHPEFNDFKWVSPELLPDLAIDFKRQTYQKIIDQFKPYFL